MPGSVQNAAPTTVMPASPCRAFVREQQARAADSRKQWRPPKRLDPMSLPTAFVSLCLRALALKKKGAPGFSKRRCRRPSRL
jgi:hypothetical protein